MSKEEFLRQLASHLGALPEAERADILADYRAYFDDAEADGRSQADVATALGDPLRLARELAAARKLKQWESHKTPSHLFQVLAASAGLGVLNLLLAFPYLLLMTILSSLWLAALSMLLAGALMSGAWLSNAVFGWPAFHSTLLSERWSQEWGVPAPLQMSGEPGEAVSIHSDAKNGLMVIEARDNHRQFKLEKASDGSVARIEASDADGRVSVDQLSRHPRLGVLLAGLVLLALGGLGSFVGWKVIRALWRGAGSWLRWQWRLLPGGAPR